MNQELIDRYENYLKNYKRSNEKTIRNYIYDLKAFDKFIDKEFTDVSEEDIDTYIQNKKDKKISPSRINFSIATLSSFYKYLKKIKITKDNPVENIPRLKIKRKKEIEYLSTYQIYETRRRLAEYGDKQLEVFFGILVASAPKKYMISKLEWRKIKWKQNYIEVVINEKERGILYLDNYTMERLAELRKERKDKHIKKKSSAIFFRLSRPMEISCCSSRLISGYFSSSRSGTLVSSVIFSSHFATLSRIPAGIGRPHKSIFFRMLVAS